MNNKTLKRVVAFLATALLVCSCAFAATIDDATVTYDATSGEIVVPFAPGEGATKAALLVRNERTDEIVALAQFNSLTNVVAFEETIDTTKVAAGDTLAISVGDNADESTSADTASVNVPALYTVTINDTVGEPVVKENVVAGTAVSTLLPETDPTKADDEDYTYTFAGWFIGEDAVADQTVTADVTVTAKFDAVPKVQYYAITLYVDGQEYDVVENVAADTAIETAIAAVTAPTKEADETNTYAFDGWYTDKECTTKLVAADVVTGHTSLYGQFIATPVEPEVPAVKVTFVNGATATEVEAVDGVVAAPATADFGKKLFNGKDATLYSWVSEDRTVEYTAGAEIPVTENMTLYAKFNTGYIHGDIDGAGVVDGSDTSYLSLYTLRKKTNTKNQNLGVPLFEGSSVKIGDIDLGGVVDGSDTSYMSLYTLRKKTNTKNTNVGKTIFVIQNEEVFIDVK